MKQIIPPILPPHQKSNAIYLRVKQVIFWCGGAPILLSTKTALAGWNVDDLEQFSLPDAPVYIIIANLFGWLLGVIWIVSMASFIIAGIIYLTASGNETQIEKAKNAMKYSIIGVIVGFSGYVILRAVTSMLSGAAWF